MIDFTEEDLQFLETQKLKQKAREPKSCRVPKPKKVKEVKQRKIREDKGEKRARYKSDLPADYRAYLNRANKKQIPFELSIEEFNNIRSHCCIYCGSCSKIGIDRRDNSDGYTLDNAVPCCTKCNMMKYTYSTEEFLEHVAKIYEYNLNE